MKIENPSLFYSVTKANGPCLIQMLLGEVQVVGLGVEDVAQLEMRASADQRRRREVEDGR